MSALYQTVIIPEDAVMSNTDSLSSWSLHLSSALVERSNEASIGRGTSRSVLINNDPKVTEHDFEGHSLPRLQRGTNAGLECSCYFY